MVLCNWTKLMQIRNFSYKKIISWYSGLVKPKPHEAPFNHIIQIGDPNLRTVSDEIPINLIKSPEITFLINRMKNVMKKYNCVGLAAPQLGIPLRVILLECNEKHIKQFSLEQQKSREMQLLPLIVLINPEMKIIDYTKTIFPENCESIRGFHADVPRYKSLHLHGFSENGQITEMTLHGWSSRIVQHEIDHLNGKLFTDIMDRKTLTCSCWEIVNERGGKVELPYYG